MSDNERIVLRTLARALVDDPDHCFLPFATTMKRTGLDRRKVRLACRSLTRKGFAEFCSGLWTDDGEMAGSGYAATSRGCTQAGVANP